jgi:outer membrane translocation and assembly module TamA
LNQEVRFPIYRWLRGVGFIDSGSLLPETRIAFKDMTTSSGFGLRLTTPFGVVRADYGRVFSVPKGVEPGSGRWTIGIGQAF